MNETRIFKTYKYSDILNTTDAAAAYDFVGAGYYEDLRDLYFPRPAEEPRKRREEWVREKDESFAGTRAISRKGQGISPLTVFGFLMAAVLLVMVLLAQIQMTALADSAAGLENRIAELRIQQNKLIASYETTFSLAEVEEYAVEELGMQKPRAEQIVYLDGVGAADRAVLLEQSEQNMFSLGFSSVLDSLWSYFG